MFKKTLCSLAVAGAVLAFIPAECFAWGRAEVDAACEAMNATYSTSSQRCVCKPGFTESNNACVPNGGSPAGSAGSGYDNGAAIREQQRREAERRAEEERQAELERQRREAENKRRIEEAERQAKFLEDRDTAASTLRGSTGNSVSSSGGLRGSSVTSGGSGLRGSSADTGLRGLKSGTTVTPNTDPMVVDARNVPSGLPKSVDDAIPHTPSGERVRKGFQAVQDGDWKVALAWFKDALNKEPGDPGIARLVDLAQFTLEYRTRPQTPAPGKNATPKQSPNQNTSNQSTKAAESKPANGVEQAAASQMAARARADAAFKKYVEKYGEHDEVGRAIAVSKAARGEGYSDAELKEQLQKALVDYRKNYSKNHPGGTDKGVGGSPTADEIVLGGKG